MSFDYAVFEGMPKGTEQFVTLTEEPTGDKVVVLTPIFEVRESTAGFVNLRLEKVIFSGISFYEVCPEMSGVVPTDTITPLDKVWECSPTHVKDLNPVDFMINAINYMSVKGYSVYLKTVIEKDFLRVVKENSAYF